MKKETYKILLVDDSTFIHKVIKEFLPDHYTCCSAMDANSALEMLKENAFDIILTDVNMPGMSGIELCSTLKAGEFKNIPIILMSSQSNSNTVSNGLEAGANDYLIKPFNKDELFVRLQTQFQLLETQREKEHLAKAEATQALIVTMSHEINNPLVIAMMKISNLLANKRNKFNMCENSKSELIKVKNALEKIKELMIKIRSIEKLETSIYADSTEMLNLDKSTTK